MSDASDAFAEAQRRVEKAINDGEASLNLYDLEHLEELPGDIAKLEGLVELWLGRVLYSTKVSDLTPLQNLTALQALDLNNTQVADVSPLQNLTALQDLNLNNTQVADVSPLSLIHISEPTRPY